MIVDAIGLGLDIGPHDVLLDLCCGNGAITDPVFARCRGGLVYRELAGSRSGREFFERVIPSPEELKRHDTLFGIWRTEQEVSKLAAGCGWRTEFSLRCHSRAMS
jgi:hypothetical protein